MGDGTFKGRITKIVFELDDFSGLYTLGDCVEFGIILYDEQNPDKDVKWYVPLNLAVDFEEQKPDVNISNKAFLMMMQEWESLPVDATWIKWLQIFMK